MIAAGFQLGTQPAYTWTGPANSSYAFLENDAPRDLFGVELSGTYSGPSIHGWSYVGDGWFNLYDYASTNWNSDALQTNFATLNAMSMSRIRLAFTDGSAVTQVRLPGALPEYGYFRNDSEVAFSVVPEPGLHLVSAL